jgi:hypothetical protein
VDNKDSAAEFAPQDCTGTTGIAPAPFTTQAARVTRKSPNTSASIFVRKKQSIASSGRQTIGSLSLNDVFSTTGTPVKSRNAEISA